ncbi:MAG: DUF1292 domain-containing protein [Bacillota bacterium]|nr:DUF1292 domain-containing protein [Bacillota bacterium]
MSKENLNETVDNEEVCNCGCGENSSKAEESTCDCDSNECDCGCGENHNMVVDLEDENGNIVACEVADSFNYKDNDYVLVQNPEDGSVYMFKVVGDDENGELVIPDDEEFEEASKFYEESLED